MVTGALKIRYIGRWTLCFAKMKVGFVSEHWRTIFHGFVVLRSRCTNKQHPAKKSMRLKRKMAAWNFSFLVELLLGKQNEPEF